MDSDLKNRLTSGNDSEGVLEAAFEIAKGLLEERKDRKESMKEFSRGFPILYQIIRYSEGLGWTGAATKKWSQFSEVYAEFMQLSNLLYDKYEDEYSKLFDDHPREERIWFMMCDKMRPIVEDLNALVIEILPELKQEIELRAESKERETFFNVLANRDKPRSSLSVAEQRRIIDEHGRAED